MLFSEMKCMNYEISKITSAYIHHQLIIFYISFLKSVVQPRYYRSQLYDREMLNVILEIFF